MLRCNRANSSFKCVSIEEHKRVFEKFNFSLIYEAITSEEVVCSNYKAKMKINYQLEINNNQFDEIKTQSYKQLTRSNRLFEELIDVIFIYI